MSGINVEQRSAGKRLLRDSGQPFLVQEDILLSSPRGI